MLNQKEKGLDISAEEEKVEVEEESSLSSGSNSAEGGQQISFEPKKKYFRSHEKRLNKQAKKNKR